MLKDFTLFRRNVSHIWNQHGEYIGDSDEEFGWFVSYKKNSKGYYYYGFEENIKEYKTFDSITKWWPFKYIKPLGGPTGNAPRYGYEWFRFQRVTEETAIACQNATGAAEPVYTFCEEVFAERMLNQVLIDMPGDHWFFIDSFYRVFL